MRIVIAAGIFPPDIGGPATYSYEFALFLATQGHTVHVICYSDTSDQIKSESINVTRIRRRTLKFITFISYLHRLSRLLKNSDIVYVQSPFAGGFQMYLLSKLYNRRYIVKVTGDYAWEQFQNQYGSRESIELFQSRRAKKPVKVRLLNFIQRRVCTGAEKIIVPSTYLSNLIQGWGVDSTKITVIHNGIKIPPRLSHKQRSQQKNNLGYSNQLVVSAGRLVPWKGFSSLIDTWQHIMRSNPEARLLIIGDGPDYHRLAEQIRSSDLNLTVQIIRGMEHVRLTQYLHAADIFVLNSSYEGLSHLLIEAMAGGAAVIASNVGGNNEIIDDMINGLLFDRTDSQVLYETIEKLLHDQELVQKLTSSAYATANKFDKNELYNRTMRLLLDEVLQSST